MHDRWLHAGKPTRRDMEMALEPGNEDRPFAMWKVMNHGTHAQIVKVLEADSQITTVLKAFKAGPSDATRDKAIDTIVRFTGNCIGQAAIQEAKGKKASELTLTPAADSQSIYKLLP